ncbi:MAG: hypothetical protein QOG79_7028 [Mycobacterium sp.]|nr:hypothetical protein [Mycobacterium sp.]
MALTERVRVATTQRVVLDGTTTWTAVSESLSVVEPAERYLEFGRQTGFAPNTIKAYARGLAMVDLPRDELEILGCSANPRLRQLPRRRPTQRVRCNRLIAAAGTPSAELRCECVCHVERSRSSPRV